MELFPSQYPLTNHVKVKTSERLGLFKEIIGKGVKKLDNPKNNSGIQSINRLLQEFLQEQEDQAETLRTGMNKEEREATLLTLHKGATISTRSGLSDERIKNNAYGEAIQSLEKRILEEEIIATLEDIRKQITLAICNKKPSDIISSSGFLDHHTGIYISSIQKPNINTSDPHFSIEGPDSQKAIISGAIPTDIHSIIFSIKNGILSSKNHIKGLLEELGNLRCFLRTTPEKLKKGIEAIKTEEEEARCLKAFRNEFGKSISEKNADNAITHIMKYQKNLTTIFKKISEHILEEENSDKDIELQAQRKIFRTAIVVLQQQAHEISENKKRAKNNENEEEIKELDKKTKCILGLIEAIESFIKCLQNAKINSGSLQEIEQIVVEELRPLGVLLSQCWDNFPQLHETKTLDTKHIEIQIPDPDKFFSSFEGEQGKVKTRGINLIQQKIKLQAQDYNKAEFLRVMIQFLAKEKLRFTEKSPDNEYKEKVIRRLQESFS